MTTKEAVLAYLRENGGEVTSKAMARELIENPSKVSSAMKQLFEKGVLKRRAAPTSIKTYWYSLNKDVVAGDPA